MNNESDNPEMVNTSEMLPMVIRNKGGRPKGKRDEGPRLSPFVLAQAKTLYLAGHSIPEISVALNIKNPLIITTRAKRENWDEEREKIMSTSSTAMLDNLLQAQMKTFEGLSIIKEKSLNRIKLMDEGDHPLPTKYSEVVNAYIASVDLEYKMKSNTLHAKFISEVATVIRKHIQDKALLTAIADDLVALYENYTQKSLSEVRKESDGGAKET